MRLGFLMLMVLMPFCLAGCGRIVPVAPVPPATGELSHVTWRLERLGEEQFAVPSSGRPYLEFESESSRVIGFTGCNGMFGDARRDGQSLRFEGLAMTKMACPDSMELERKFLGMLELVRGWRHEHPHLELLGANGESLARFVAGPASSAQD